MARRRALAGAATCCLARGLAARAPLADELQLLQAFAAARGLPEAAPVGAFVDDGGTACFEGPSRIVEAALATRKASPYGGLFNLTFAHPNLTCGASGYDHRSSLGDDVCFPRLRVFHRSQAGERAFAEAQAQALAAWGAAYSLDLDTAELMAACTCHPESQARRGEGYAQRCDDLSRRTRGSWIHRSPGSGHALLCDEGPFEYAARALATLKSSPLLPLHEHDTVAPRSCAEQGFPMAYIAPDHCYPQLRMWTRTEQPRRDCPPGGLGTDNPDCDDAGVLEAQAVEGDLVYHGGFIDFAKAHGLSVVPFNSVACNCRADSEVGLTERQGDSVCDFPELVSPVRDFWTA